MASDGSRLSSINLDSCLLRGALSVTICVPDVYWKECTDMIKDSAMNGIPVSCISGRDRYECIERVGRKEADVVAVDPEDMYLAVKDNALAAKAGYSIVEQVV